MLVTCYWPALKRFLSPPFWIPRRLWERGCDPEKKKTLNLSRSHFLDLVPHNSYPHKRQQTWGRVSQKSWWKRKVSRLNRGLLHIRFLFCLFYCLDSMCYWVRQSNHIPPNRLCTVGGTTIGGPAATCEAANCCYDYKRRQCFKPLWFNCYQHDNKMYCITPMKVLSVFFFLCLILVLLTSRLLFDFFSENIKGHSHELILLQ